MNIFFIIFTMTDTLATFEFARLDYPQEEVHILYKQYIDSIMPESLLTKKGIKLHNEIFNTDARVKEGLFWAVGETVLENGAVVGKRAEGPCVSDCTGADVGGEVTYGTGEGMGRGRGFEVW